MAQVEPTSPPKIVISCVAIAMLALAATGPVSNAKQNEGHSATPEKAPAAQSPAETSGHAAEKAGHAPAGDAPQGEEAEKPSHRLGKPLDGYYDYFVLRRTDRVVKYRFALEGIRLTLTDQHKQPRLVMLDLAVEFGRESGMAEMQENKKSILEWIQPVILGYSPEELLLPSGKRRLKEAIVNTLNHRLKTAWVRQVYITHFVVARSRL